MTTRTTENQRRASGGSAGGRSSEDAEHLRNNPVFRATARLGFATSGLLQLLVGVLAVQVALGGGGGQRTDQSGALSEVVKTPGGAVVLGVGVVGSFALALWFVVQALLRREPDPEDRGKERAKDLGKAVVYGVVGGTALRFALGSGSSSSSSEQKGTATILSLPGGPVLVALIGLAVIALGGVLAHRGWSKRFTEELTVPGGTAGRAVIVLGQVGYLARGLAVAVVGVLFVVAAFTADAKRASGLDGALKAFADLPSGKVVLLVVALGWVASGVYFFVRAWRARMR